MHHQNICCCCEGSHASQVLFVSPWEQQYSYHSVNGSVIIPHRLKRPWQPPAQRSGLMGSPSFRLFTTKTLRTELYVISPDGKPSAYSTSTGDKTAVWFACPLLLPVVQQLIALLVSRLQLSCAAPVRPRLLTEFRQDQWPWELKAKRRLAASQPWLLR